VSALSVNAEVDHGWAEPTDRYYACQTAHSDTRYSTRATAMKAIAINLTSRGKLNAERLRND